MEFCVKSLLGGVWIGIAAQVSLGAHPILAPFVFAIGLLAIVYGDYFLFTGKAGTDMEVVDLGFMFAINGVGAMMVPSLLGPEEQAKLAQILQTKNSLNIIELFVAGFLCGMLMYFATQLTQKNPILIIVGVSAFIIAGFEHSIANYAYFSLGLQQHIVSNPLIFVVPGIGNYLGAQTLYRAKLIKD